MNFVLRIMNRAVTTQLFLLTLGAAWLAAPPAHAKGGDDSPGGVFQGVIQTKPSTGLIGDWQIGGKLIHVVSSTKFTQYYGPVALGACAQIKGQSLPDTSINASEFEVTSSSGGCQTSTQASGNPLEFYGFVQTMPAVGLAGDWQIGGRTAHVTAATQIKLDKSAPAVGACAQVKGLTAADGTVNASEVQMKSSASDCGDTGSFHDDFLDSVGAIQSLPANGLVGDWKIAGRTVHASASTQVRQESGVALVGGCAEVKGQLLSDNSLSAASIEVKSCSGGNSGGDSLDAFGLIQKLPASGLTGDWQISGRVYHVLANTVVRQDDGLVAIGACVEAKGQSLADNTINASQVEVRSVSGTCISPRGVVSSGSYLSGRVSPGEIVSLFGFSLGPSTAGYMELGDDHKVSTSIGSVRVLFDGVPAPLTFVSMGLINAIVPYSVAGKSSTQIQVEFNGVWSNALIVPVVASNPSLFTYNGSGSGPGAIVNQDYSLNTAANPADKGSVVVLYATGGGAFNRLVQDGEIIGDDHTKPLLPVTVTIGGIQAEVLYGGAAPSLVAGVLQVNVRVPGSVPSGGAVPIVLIVGDQSSQAGVTLAIR